MESEDNHFATDLYQRGDIIECYGCELNFDGELMKACSCCGNPYCRQCMKEHYEP